MKITYTIHNRGGDEGDRTVTVSSHGPKEESTIYKVLRPFTIGKMPKYLASLGVTIISHDVDPVSAFENLKEKS